MITPYTPENKASIGIQYAFALSGGGTFTPRLDAAYTDEVYANAVNAPTNFIDGYDGLQRAPDLAVGRRDLGSRARGHEPHGRVLLRDVVRPLGHGAGYIHGQPSRPREYAMTVKRNF